MIAMIGTSDRLCWLAETCKILLLLLLRAPPMETPTFELRPLAVSFAPNKHL